MGETPLLTLGRIMDSHPCWLLDRVRQKWGDRQTATPMDVVESDLKPSDKVWLLIRTGILPDWVLRALAADFVVMRLRSMKCRYPWTERFVKVAYRMARRPKARWVMNREYMEGFYWNWVSAGSPGGGTKAMIAARGVLRSPEPQWAAWQSAYLVARRMTYKAVYRVVERAVWWLEEMGWPEKCPKRRRGMKR